MYPNIYIKLVLAFDIDIIIRSDKMKLYLVITYMTTSINTINSILKISFVNQNES